MKIVGFTFSKIAGEKDKDFKLPSGISVGIEFTDFEKDKADFLKEDELVKISFNHVLNYEQSKKKDKIQGKLEFDGTLILSVSKEESKQIQKGWKKKQIPIELQSRLFNFILKKSAPKALQLQDDMNLPSHIPIRQVQMKRKE